MKTTFRFSILFHLFACLFLATACSDDTLPATTDPGTEQPETAPDALHDKTRESHTLKRIMNFTSTLLRSSCPKP